MTTLNTILKSIDNHNLWYNHSKAITATWLHTLKYRSHDTDDHYESGIFLDRETTDFLGSAYDFDRALNLLAIANTIYGRGNTATEEAIEALKHEANHIGLPNNLLQIFIIWIWG